MKAQKTITWLGFAAALAILLGFFLTLMGYQKDQSINRLQSAPIRTAKQITTAQENTDFLITGILTGETASSGNRYLDATAEEMKLVIYQTQEWVLGSDQEGSAFGKWLTKQYISPDYVRIDDVPIRVIFYSYENLYVNFNGDYFESKVIVEGQGDVLDGIRVGSKRLIGYSGGDRITIFGKILPDQVFSIEQIYLGESDEYVEMSVDEGWYRKGYLYFGLSLLVIGAVGILFYFSLAKKKKSKRKKRSNKNIV